MANYFIFRCSNATHKECLDRNLFGQNITMLNYFAQLNIGDILFLHNLSNNIIEGPFFATSTITQNIIPEAWNGEFPYQVTVEKKGRISEITRASFDKFGLRFSNETRFFEFKIPKEIGRKLVEEMGLELNMERREITNVNPIENIDIDFRLKYEAKIRCEDGHYVRSISELSIDNWLFNHNIVHSYEKKIIGEYMVCDFYVKNRKNEEMYIEFWGLDNSEVYKRRMKEKEAIYKKRNLRLLNILSVNIQNIDDYLGEHLKDFMN